MSWEAGSAADASRLAEKASTAAVLGTSLDAIQERTRGWLELKLLYAELISEIEKPAELAAEQATVNDEIGAFRQNGLLQKPPYALDFYDLVQAEYDALGQALKTSDLSLSASKTILDQLQARVQDAQKQLRNFQDLHNGDSGPAINWQLEGIQLDIQRAEVRRRIEMRKIDNLKLERQILDMRSQLAQEKLDRVKAGLVFHADDLKRQEAALEEKKKELHQALDDLAGKMREAERNRIKAQAQFQGAADNRKAAQAQALLKGWDLWRKTYSEAQDQFEDRIRLLDQQQAAWQKRYAILAGQTEHDTLLQWHKETAQRIENLDRSIFLEQQRQNGLWRQINTIEEIKGASTAQGGLPHTPIETQALRQMAVYGLDYLGALSATLQLERRVRGELDAKLARAPLRYRVEQAWNQVRGIWNYELWVIDDRPLTAKKILVAIFILIIGIIATRTLIRRLAKKLLHRPQVKATTASAIEKLLLYFAYLMVVLFALRMVNIPLTAFAFVGGAVAIGLGFGAQNLINNFISGFIIMGEQPISIGDLIEVDGVLGQVEEVGARCTRIRTGENIHILVPNSSFLEKNITNWTLSDRMIRAHVTVGVIYGSPVAQVRDLLLQACGEFSEIRKDPEAFVLFVDFADSALLFEVHFWILVERVIQRRTIESRLRYRIDEMFRQAGIVIAFPQQDVHLDTSQPLQVRLLDGDHHGQQS